MFDWAPDEPLWLTTGDKRLEARCWGPDPATAPTLILLHEGLGSTRLWKDFPEKLARTTGYGVFAYSRTGYGNSDPAELPRPLDYMTQEAMNVLPKVLDLIGFQKGVLLGHSDGASIAAVYAGGVADMRVRALCLISPHFFTEPMGLASIAKARSAYKDGDLRKRLARHHKDPDNAFYGWNRAWLNTAFRSWNIEEYIAYIRAPVLVIQGRQDQYGTMAQILALETALNSPLQVEILAECRHSPHIERPDKALEIISSFIQRLERIENVEVSL